MSTERGTSRQRDSPIPFIHQRNQSKTKRPAHCTAAPEAPMNGFGRRAPCAAPRRAVPRPLPGLECPGGPAPSPLPPFHFLENGSAGPSVPLGPISFDNLTAINVPREQTSSCSGSDCYGRCGRGGRWWSDWARAQFLCGDASAFFLSRARDSAFAGFGLDCARRRVMLYRVSA